jgi:hypothetical protein
MMKAEISLSQVLQKAEELSEENREKILNTAKALLDKQREKERENLPGKRGRKNDE